MRALIAASMLSIVALGACDNGGSDAQPAASSTTTAVDTVPVITGLSSGLTPPDACEAAPAADLAEVVGSVTSSEPGLEEGVTSGEASSDFAASTCTYTVDGDPFSIALIVTTDPDGYVSYLEAQEGNTVVGDADLDGLPETTVVIDHEDGSRTYLVADEALYTTTGPPGLARSTAAWLYSRL